MTPAVTIVNGYPDDNKGSSAIAWGLIRRLEALGVENFALVSMVHDVIPDVHHRHLIRRFPDLKILPSPLYGRSETIPRLASARVSTTMWPGYVAAAVAAGQLRVQRQRLMVRGSAFERIQSSDWVMDRGGPFFAASAAVLNPSLLFYAWPLEFARLEGVPYALIGESVGTIASLVGRRFVRRLCREARLVGVRDEQSRSHLGDAGVDTAQVAVMLDNAFWVEPQMTSRVAALLEKNRLEQGRFLVLTARNWYRQAEEKYHDELAIFVNRALADGWERVALVSNTFDPLGDNDDRRATADLQRRVGRPEAVVVIDDDLAADELAALYGAAGALLGTRLHSAILALSAGTPAIAVAYDPHKTHGVMNNVGAGDAVVDLTTFSAERALGALEAALRQSNRVTATIDRLRAEGDATLRSTLTYGDFR